MYLSGHIQGVRMDPGLRGGSRGVRVDPGGIIERALPLWNFSVFIIPENLLYTSETPSVFAK